jgi:hypothetical protein
LGETSKGDPGVVWGGRKGLSEVDEALLDDDRDDDDPQFIENGDDDESTQMHDRDDHILNNETFDTLADAVIDEVEDESDGW